jgi:hypothetical protein
LILVGHFLTDLQGLSMISFSIIHFHPVAQHGRPSQYTGFYYVNCIWFIVNVFLLSTVSLPPLFSLTYWTIYSVKDFPVEDIQSSSIIFCHSPGFFGICKYWPHKCFMFKNF